MTARSSPEDNQLKFSLLDLNRLIFIPEIVITMKQIFFQISTIISTLSLLAGSALAQEVPSTLRQEMPYAEARQIILDAGWQAILLSPNRRGSSVENHLIHELGYREFVACASTGAGFCRAEFRTADQQKLILITVNNGSGREPILYSWTLEEDS
jgi:hypothetical protein